ncbi:hypothetical protein DASC09_033790 [Saccharomycopsis crataegensis]|uniref:D-arabinitol 2-dehydrogenase [ribulose-forming] n=1 Tax=Saccharomycopsis crataegensis TaxID=43959 RepID=A0AAV5QMT1_9ASCO|nr:hypothetical protein DASC09_033790 [Saccharomycopsis crataegensis]
MTQSLFPKITDIVPSFRLDNRLAIVTGGSGGLATVISKALLAQGASVALVDMIQERVDVSAEELAEWGSFNKIPLTTPEGVNKISSWQCNVADDAEVTKVFNEVNVKHEAVADLLIHTAGFCQNIDALDYPAKNAQNLVNVNLMGSLYCSQAIARNLVAVNKPGSLILIGSMSGVIVNDPQPQVAYNMSKAGVIHLVKSLACEWAKHGIRVNALSPGYIATPLTKQVLSGNDELKQTWESKVPMHRMADPKEFVGTILYLANSEASSYTTGENIMVDGGYQCW